MAFAARHMSPEEMVVRDVIPLVQACLCVYFSDVWKLVSGHDWSSFAGEVLLRGSGDLHLVEDEKAQIRGGGVEDWGVPLFLKVLLSPEWSKLQTLEHVRVMLRLDHALRAVSPDARGVRAADFRMLTLCSLELARLLGASDEDIGMAMRPSPALPPPLPPAGPPPVPPRTTGARGSEQAPDMDKALRFKAGGNAEFLAGRYGPAIEEYTRGLALAADGKPEVGRSMRLASALLANRSLAKFRLGHFQAALEDAQEALARDSTWMKPFVRLAMAQKALGRCAEACVNCARALGLGDLQRDELLGLQALKRQCRSLADPLETAGYMVAAVGREARDAAASDGSLDAEPFDFALAVRTGDLQGVVQALAAGDERSAARGCAAVQMLVGQDAGNQAKLGALGACEAAVKVFGAWGRGSRLMAGHACWTVVKLASDGAEENRTKLVRGGAGGAVVESLRAWGKTDPIVAAHGCAALAELAASRDGSKRQLGSAGACEAVVVVLGEWRRRDPTVAAEACQAIAALAGDAANLAQLGRAGVCELVVDAVLAWTHEDWRVAKQGCGAVDALAVASICARKLGGAGAYEALASVLRKWTSTNGLVCRKACGALASLSRAQASFTEASARDVCGAVVQALGAWGDKDSGLALDACYMVQTLAEDDDNRVELVRLQACEAVMGALCAWGCTDRGVAATACAGILNLSQSGSGQPSGAALLVELGAGEAVVEVLRFWMRTSDAFLIRVACGAIENLVMVGAGADRLSGVDAGAALVEVLQRWGRTSPEAAQAACSAMVTFSSTRVNSLRLGELGGCEAVVDALKWTKCASSDLAFAGLSAAGVMGKDEGNLSRLVHAGVLEAAMETLEVLGLKYPGIAFVGLNVIRLVSDAWAARVKQTDSARDGTYAWVVGPLRAFGTTNQTVAGEGCAVILGLVLIAQNSDERQPASDAAAVQSLAQVDKTVTGKLIESGACEAVTGALTAWGNMDQRVACLGCSAIFCFAQHDWALPRLRNAGACEAVVESLCTWTGTSRTVAYYGCMSVQRLSLDPVNEAKLGVLRAGEAVVQFLRTWGKAHQEFAVAGCLAVKNLSTSPGANRWSLAACGAGEVVADMMRYWGAASAEVSMVGCLAIANLGKFGKLRECVAVLDVANAWGKESAVAAGAACAALSILAGTEANCIALGDAGACELLVDVLNAWGPAEPNVAERACLAMDKLAGNAENAGKLGRAGACEAIVRALRTRGARAGPALWQTGRAALDTLAQSSPANHAPLASLGLLDLQG